MYLSNGGQLGSEAPTPTPRVRFDYRPYIWNSSFSTWIYLSCDFLACRWFPKGLSELIHKQVHPKRGTGAWEKQNADPTAFG